MGLAGLFIYGTSGTWPWEPQYRYVVVDKEYVKGPSDDVIATHEGPGSVTVPLHTRPTVQLALGADEEDIASQLNIAPTVGGQGQAACEWTSGGSHEVRDYVETYSYRIERYNMAGELRGTSDVLQAEVVIGTWCSP